MVPLILRRVLVSVAVLWLITLLVFAGFSVFYLKEPLTLNHMVGFLLIGAGAFFIFKGPLPK